MPSTYYIEAKNEFDISAAVRFAQQFNLRLVVKATGIKYEFVYHLIALVGIIPIDANIVKWPKLKSHSYFRS